MNLDQAILLALLFPAVILRNWFIGGFKKDKDNQEAVFVSYASKLWNTTPVEIRHASTLNSFKRQLQMCLFTLAFN